MIIIKEAKITDISNIYKCSNDSLPISYNYFEILNFILHNKYKVFVAYDNNDFLAYAICNNNIDDNLHIMSIATYKQYRSKGIGSKLLNEIYKQCKSITLYVHKDNEKGIDFYKKNNFIIEKEIDNYYNNYFTSGTNNAYFMKKSF
jgi:ribosomal protein S18 acetylase RimI-like enzyme